MTQIELIDRLCAVNTLLKKTKTMQSKQHFAIIFDGGKRK